MGKDKRRQRDEQKRKEKLDRMKALQYTDTLIEEVVDQEEWDMYESEGDTYESYTHYVGRVR